MSNEKYSADQREDKLETNIRVMLLEMSIDETMYRKSEIDIDGYSRDFGTAHFIHANGHKLLVEFYFENDLSIFDLNVSLSY